MRTFKYVEPGADGVTVYRRVREDDIMKTYFPYWCKQMEKVGKSDLISPELCIQDWITVHWAEELSDVHD